MPIYSYKIEVFLPQRRAGAKKKKKKNNTGNLASILDEGRLLSFVIPGWVAAGDPQEAKEHAERIGRGMLIGSRYNEWQDVYQLDLVLTSRIKRRMYWTVANIRECKDGILVQNAYGMEGVQLVPGKPQALHPFLQSFLETRNAAPGQDLQD